LSFLTTDGVRVRVNVQMFAVLIASHEVIVEGKCHLRRCLLLPH